MKSLPAILAISLALAGAPSSSSAEELFRGKAYLRTVSFNADNLELRDALRLVVKKGGLNAVIDDSIKGPVNIDLNDVPLGKALETLMFLGGLHCYEQGNILTFVSRSEALKRGLIHSNAKTFKIRFASASKLAESINSAVFGASNAQASADPRTNTITVLGSPQEIERANQLVRELDIFLERKVFKLNNANAVQIASILNSSIFNFGSGGQTSQVVADVETMRDSAGLSSNSSGAQLGQGSSTIRSSGISTQKVDVPNRAPTVVPDTRTNSVIVIGTPEQLALAADLVQQLDQRSRQVAIDVEVIELSERGSFELGTGFSGQEGKTKYGFDPNGTTPTSVEKDSTFFPVSSSFRVKVSALIGQKKAKLLANPKITTADNTEAQLEIVDEVIKGTQVSSAGVGANNQNLVVVQPIFGVAGIVLNILPKIGADGYITLRLHPTISNIREIQKDSQNNQITLLSRRDLLTQQVQVMDKGTLAIGGITQDNVIRNHNKLPLLGDLPLLGSLFSWQSEEKTKTELLILLTPRILSDQDPLPKKPF